MSPSCNSSSGNNSSPAADANWPEIIETAKAGQSFKISMAEMESAKKTRHQRQINIRRLSSEDLSSLKKQDPFLYYSIPAVRSVSLQLERQGDTSNPGDSRLTRRSSLPSSLRKLHQEDQASQTTMVRRRTTISYECHPDTLLFDDDDIDADDTLDL